MLGGAIAVLAALAAGAATPPSPTRWVEDEASFLTPATRAALDTRLETYQRATGHQVVVWIGVTLDGAPLDDWAVRTFAAWEVGRKGSDDGLAMFIFADDRAIDIEVGYGLEDKVPDAIASRIIREVMAPQIRAGDRDGAVTAGVDAILTAIEGHAWTDPGSGAPSPLGGLSVLQWVLGALAAIGALILLVTHPRMALLLLWTIASGGRGGGGGFGGGGGRSGGGGARGGW